MTVNLIKEATTAQVDLYDPFITHVHKLSGAGNKWIETFVTPNLLHPIRNCWHCPKTGKFIEEQTEKPNSHTAWLLEIAEHLDRLEGVGDPVNQSHWKFCETTVRAAGRKSASSQLETADAKIQVWVWEQEEDEPDIAAAEIRIEPANDSDISADYLKTGIQREAIKAGVKIINDDEPCYLYIGIQRESQDTGPVSHTVEVFQRPKAWFETYVKPNLVEDQQRSIYQCPVTGTTIEEVKSQTASRSRWLLEIARHLENLGRGTTLQEGQ